MNKEELIAEISAAFKDTRLDDGVGLWEGQGLDDYADAKTLMELKRKDERKDWDKISIPDLSRCASSLHFFDAKGMRFHLPKFLIADISGHEIYASLNIQPPDVLFTLTSDLNGDYQRQRFSLLNNAQLHCIIHYLEYRIDQMIQLYNGYAVTYGSDIHSLEYNPDYRELKKALSIWEERLN